MAAPVLTCCVAMKPPSACLVTWALTTDAATGFLVVEVVPFKQNIKNIEVLLITDDAESSPTKGGLLNLTAKDVLDITDPIDHTLYVLGNPGDVVNLEGRYWSKCVE